MTDLSLQERYAPDSRCFGCGPANDQGLHVQSHPDGDELVADWRPEPRFEAFDGYVNGGVISTLLDCHSNWAAVRALMERRAIDRPPGCVTVELAVRFVRPTPSSEPLRLRARPVEVSDDRVTVEAELVAGGRVTATARGTFVAVRPDHPAYDRW